MRIGRYELDEAIGRGAAGVVYRGHAPGGQPVALKVLSARTPAVRARFAREVRLLGSLGAADGFVPLLDSGEDNGAPWLAMPLMEGGTLRARLERGPLPVEEARSLGVALATALGRAHAKGIVHRDLKPENILFTREGCPLVADLGIARHWNDDSPGASQSVSLTRSGQVLGTASYCSPEQAAGAANAGPPADVFALGAILYECLAGRPVFEGATVLEVLAKVSEALHEPLATVAPHVPPALTAAIEAALAQDATKRPRDGGAFAHRLEGRGAGRDPRARWVLAVGSLAVLAGIALALAAARPAPVQTRTTAPLAPAPKSDAPAGGDPRPPAHFDELSASAHFARASQRAARGDPQGAIDDYTRALELRPGYPDALAGRGIVRAEHGDAAGALADFDRAVKATPGDVRFWVNRGLLRETTADLDGAASDFRRATEIDSKCAIAWNGLGIIADRQDEPEVALAHFDRAVEADGSCVEAWINRSGIHEKLRHPAQAREDLDRAIALAPGHVEGWVMRANQHAGQGEMAAALADATRALEIAPDFARAHKVRGFIAVEQGDRAVAREHFEEALRLGLTPPEAESVRHALSELARSP